MLESKNFVISNLTSEMYGLNNKEIYDETCKFIPNSPYASGKLSNHKKICSLKMNIIGIFTQE